MLKLVILPQWLVDALKAANLDLADALEVKNLLTILSKEDVAFYLYVNSVGMGPTLVLRDSVLGSISGEFSGSTDSLFQLLVERVGANDYDGDVLKAYDALVAKGRVAVDSGQWEVYRREIKAQLLNHWQQPEDNEVVAYEVRRLGSDAVALIPIVIPATDDHSQHKKECDQLLNILCGAYPFTRVASTSLFKSYVRLCSVS